MLCLFLRLPALSKMVKTLDTAANFEGPLPGWPRKTADLQFLPCFTSKKCSDPQKPEEFQGSGRRFEGAILASWGLQNWPLTNCVLRGPQMASIWVS